MSTTEDPIEGQRERGSSKLLAVWGHRGPAGDAATDWSAILRRDGAALQAPRVVVSGTAMSGLVREPMMTGVVHV
jgi:hypothetical protein